MDDFDLSVAEAKSRIDEGIAEDVEDAVAQLQEEGIIPFGAVEYANGVRRALGVPA